MKSQAFYSSVHYKLSRKAPSCNGETHHVNAGSQTPNLHGYSLIGSDESGRAELLAHDAKYRYLRVAVTAHRKHTAR